METQAAPGANSVVTNDLCSLHGKTFLARITVLKSGLAVGEFVNVNSVVATECDEPTLIASLSERLACGLQLYSLDGDALPQPIQNKRRARKKLDKFVLAAGDVIDKQYWLPVQVNLGLIGDIRPIDDEIPTQGPPPTLMPAL